MAANTTPLTGAALMQSLLEDPQYAGQGQKAVDAYNIATYGNTVNGPSDKGYGSSPEYYAATGQVGMPDAYLVPGANGSYQTIERPKQGPAPNLPPATGLTPPVSQPAVIGGIPPTINTGTPTTQLGGQLGQVKTAMPADYQNAINAQLAQGN